MKPILFNTEMVQAILDGRKTVTRRLVKPHNPVKASRMGGYSQGNGLWIDTDIDNGDGKGHIKDYSVSCTWWTIGEYIKRFAPYKQGDILYVRETWSYGPFEDYLYRASHETYGSYGNWDDILWKPSIHMPKQAARIYLKVTDVRIEKLKNMNGTDVLKEGVNSHVHPKADYFNGNQLDMFERLWNSTVNKKDIACYGWDANPYVWVIEFERCEKPVD